MWLHSMCEINGADAPFRIHPTPSSVWAPCGKKLVGLGPAGDCSLPLSVRNWWCPIFQTKHDRDVNAAINIRQQGIIKLRAEGLSIPASGGLCKPGHKPAAA